MLSALCWLYTTYLSSKGGNGDELQMIAGTPEIVKMHRPTKEDWEKIEEKKINIAKKSFQGLISIAEGSGVKATTVSRQQFFKDFGYE